MKRVDVAKLAFAVIGVAIWAYGVRTDQPNLEWLGIGVLIIAFLIRFLSRARPPRE